MSAPVLTNAILDALDLNDDVVDIRLHSLMRSKDLSSSQLTIIKTLLQYKLFLNAREDDDCDNSIEITLLKELLKQIGVQNIHHLADIVTICLLLDKSTLHVHSEHFLQQIWTEIIECCSRESNSPILLICYLKIFDAVLDALESASATIRVFEEFLLESLLESEEDEVKKHLIVHTCKKILNVVENTKLLENIWKWLLNRRCNKFQDVLFILSAFAHYYLPITKNLGQSLDLTKYLEFWDIIMQSIDSFQPEQRKYGLFLLKRSLDVALTKGVCVKMPKCETVYISWNNNSEKLQVKEQFTDYFILFESIEEFQCNIVQSALNLFNKVKDLHNNLIMPLIKIGLVHNNHSVKENVLRTFATLKFQARNTDDVKMILLCLDTTIGQLSKKEFNSDLTTLLDLFFSEVSYIKMTLLNVSCVHWSPESLLAILEIIKQKQIKNDISAEELIAFLKNIFKIPCNNKQMRFDIALASLQIVLDNIETLSLQLMYDCAKLFYNTFKKFQMKKYAQYLVFSIKNFNVDNLELDVLDFESKDKCFASAAFVTSLHFIGASHLKQPISLTREIENIHNKVAIGNCSCDEKIISFLKLCTICDILQCISEEEAAVDYSKILYNFFYNDILPDWIESFCSIDMALIQVSWSYFANIISKWGKKHCEKSIMQQVFSSNFLNYLLKYTAFIYESNGSCLIEEIESTYKSKDFQYSEKVMLFKAQFDILLGYELLEKDKLKLFSILEQLTSLGYITDYINFVILLKQNMENIDEEILNSIFSKILSEMPDLEDSKHDACISAIVNTINDIPLKNNFGKNLIISLVKEFHSKPKVLRNILNSLRVYLDDIVCHILINITSYLTKQRKETEKLEEQVELIEALLSKLHDLNTCTKNALADKLMTHLDIFLNNKKRYYCNSDTHIMLESVLIVTSNCKSSTSSIWTEDEWLCWNINLLKKMAHQPSVKYIIELNISQSLFGSAQEKDCEDILKFLIFTEIATSSIIKIMYWGARDLIKDEKNFDTVINFIMPHTMGQQFCLRLLAQYVTVQLFRIKPELSIKYSYTWKTIVEALKMFDNEKALIEMKNNALLNKIKVTPREIILLKQTEFNKTRETNEVEGGGDSKIMTVQKKFVPWNEMESEIGVCSFRDKCKRESGLILVASLLEKLPNLGGLARTGEVFGIEKYIVPHLKVLQENDFRGLSVSSEKWIDIEEVKCGDDLKIFIQSKKQEGYSIVAAEQTCSSQKLNQFQFPKKTLLLLGNEKSGVPCDLLPYMDYCVEIPQHGVIRSLNVHVTAAIFVWEYVRQHWK